MDRIMTSFDQNDAPLNPTNPSNSTNPVKSSVPTNPINPANLECSLESIVGPTLPLAFPTSSTLCAVHGSTQHSPISQLSYLRSICYLCCTNYHWVATTLWNLLHLPQRKTGLVPMANTCLSCYPTISTNHHHHPCGSGLLAATTTWANISFYFVLH